LADGKLLLIPLFQSERAWAYAMQLKQEANTEPRKKFRLVNRLKKCVKFASELEKLSESEKCDARTKLEAQGYSSLISGQFFFETQKWNESLKFFNVSK
jgi:signal recognition particle subunit SRP68